MILVSSLTFSYHPREDRMIFTVNHNDPVKRLDFLVTRRKLIELLNGFDEILINLCDNGKIFKELYHNQEPLEKPQEVKKVEEKKEEVSKEDKKEEKKDSKPESKSNDNDKTEPKEKALEQPKWEKSISSNELNFTKNKEPLLLDAISYTKKKNLITFKFISNKQQHAASIMTCETFQRTLSSLMRVIPFVHWGISPHILD
jgi:hypothetical protein